MAGAGSMAGWRMVALISLLVLSLSAPSADAAKPRKLSIEVISNRADLISGGDALVAVNLPRGARAKDVRVAVGRRNVTKAFARRPDGRFQGLVTGLKLGRNVLTAKLRDGRRAKVAITNHRIGGPVFSGPQVQPWVCRNGSSDPQCNAPTTYDFQYMSSRDDSLHPYDPDDPPDDVATTTTQTGETVPFVIRIETGYQDRDQYKIATLYQPDKPWTAWAPQPQFNHKLVITHGFSCAIERQSGEAPSVTSDVVGSSSPTTALGLGFAVMSTALNHAGHNCNLVTQAESLVMAKEHLIETYGTLRYTIGTGCSGGSLTQQQVANAYPGIYQGILPQCSFPDAWSTGQQLAAYHVTRGYFEHPEKWGTGVVWTPTQIGAVEGHPNHANAIIFDSIYWNALADPEGGPTNLGIDASAGCSGVKREEQYDSESNPGGVRCTLADYMINVFGPRPRELWTENEKKIGRGFAGLPIGDVGVQFGLQALKDGTITPAQFVDLNDKIGGADIDLQYTRARSDATQPALRNDYRSGAINEANNLQDVAIIDLRGPDPGAFHDAYRTWTIRARLERAEGRFPRNHVIWFGHQPLIGDTSYTTEALLAEDRWLTAVERDRRRVSLARKVQEDRPADVQDRCSSIPGVEQVNLPGVGKVCENRDVQTRYATPVMVAGESVATDIVRCQLQPLRREDYYPIHFTDDEWATLNRVFPGGVCDWTKRGVSQRGTVPWLNYQRDAAGRKVIYGGKSLRRAPRGSGSGWTSSVFAGWRTGQK